MSARDAEQVWLQIKQFQSKPLSERNEYDYRLSLIKLLEELFLCDLAFAYEKKADIMFFTVQKESLERLKSQFDKKGIPQTPAEKVNYNSALNQCFCELIELTLLVQQKYGFVIDDVPPPFAVSIDTLMPEKDSVLTPVLRDKFINFVCLRLGDISRYMLDYNTARVFYKRAVKALPNDGQAHNQIGLIEAAENKLLDSLYEHVLAISTTEPFTPAAANVENLYKKFASINIDDKRLRYDAALINFAGRCHNLLEETDSLIPRLSILLRAEGIQLVSLEKCFVILISIWNNMVNTGDEIKCAENIASVVVDQFLYLIQNYLEASFSKSDCFEPLLNQASGIRLIFHALNFASSFLPEVLYCAFQHNVNDKFASNEKYKILSLIWIYASWLDEKKTSLARKAPKETSWIENFANLVDNLNENDEIDNEVQHLQYFCPVTSFNFNNFNASSLLLRLKSIFYRILRFYRIVDIPSENFLEFFRRNSGLFVEKRRMRISHTVPILSSL